MPGFWSQLIEVAVETIDVKFEIEAGEGDAIACAIGDGFPGVVCGVATTRDLWGFLGNEDVFLKAVEFLIVGEFLLFVECLGTF